MGSGSSAKKYSGTTIETATPAPTLKAQKTLTIEEVAAGRLSQPKACENCCVPLMVMQGAYGKTAYQCPQCGWMPDRRSLSKNNLDIAPPNAAFANADGRAQSKQSSTRPASKENVAERRPSKSVPVANLGERRPSKSLSVANLGERRPSKEKMSRSSSKATTDAPSDLESTLGSTGDLPNLQRVVRRRATEPRNSVRRSISLPGVNEDIGFAPGDKVIFQQYDAQAEDDFGIGVVTSLGEKQGIVRVKFEKSDRELDFKALSLKKLSTVEEKSLKHGSKLARRSSLQF